MKRLNWISCLFILCLSPFLWSQEDARNHKHEKGEHAHGHQDDEKDEDHKEHDHEGEKQEKHAHGDKDGDHAGDEHGHEEGGSNVGPEKGILEASDETGIRLAPTALKNFEIKTARLNGNGPWTIPLSAQLQAGEETNVYRLRGGFFKRIDFKLHKKTPDQITITSEDLKPGDEIVVNGIGFLRIAELAAFGGAPEGHSH